MPAIWRERKKHNKQLCALSLVHSISLTSWIAYSILDIYVVCLFYSQGACSSAKREKRIQYDPLTVISPVLHKNVTLSILRHRTTPDDASECCTFIKKYKITFLLEQHFAWYVMSPILRAAEALFTSTAYIFLEYCGRLSPFLHFVQFSRAAPLLYW